ncbi:MAG: hypothetical protein V3T72_04905 [Thermoanaerobaculia bacterium]
MLERLYRRSHDQGPKAINLRKPPTLRKGAVRQSKRVRDRLKAAESLLTAIENWKSTAAAGFRAKLESGLRDGETVPDQSLALELAGRSVEAAVDALLRADAVYCNYADARKALDHACNRLAGEIYPELVDVRRAIDTRFGREAGRRFHGLEGSTRRKPRRQHPQLEGVVSALKSPEPLPKPIRPGPPGEREHWLAQLEPGCKELTRVLRELLESEIREASRRQDRDFELESFDVDYNQALGFVRSVFRFAGLDEQILWKLLPTVQRRHLKGKARRESEARAKGRRE